LAISHYENEAILDNSVANFVASFGAIIRFFITAPQTHVGFAFAVER
jgi:hypothetical protein